MEKRSLVSIITPTYNHQEFIGKCIESVLAQTYPYWEQVIIDDGSTDRTAEIVSRYKDRRIKYIRQNHVGLGKLSESYNKALKISQGELIAILEGDDFWPSDKLSKQVPVFGKKEVVMSAGRAAITNRKGKTIFIAPYEKDLKQIKDLTRKEMIVRLLHSNFIYSCTAMCRKDALLSIGGFKQLKDVFFVDYPTWLELSLIGKICLLEDILGFYRQYRMQSTSKWMREIFIEGHNKCVMTFWKKLPQKMKDFLGLNISILQSYLSRRTGSINFGIGRMNLFKHHWQEARKNFKEAFDKGDLLTKYKALIGICFSYLKIDMEWLAFLKGIPQINQFLQ